MTETLEQYRERRELELSRCADGLVAKLTEQNWNALQEAVPRALRKQLAEADQALAQAQAAQAKGTQTLAAHQASRPATVEDVQAWSDRLTSLERAAPQYATFVQEAETRRHAIAHQAARIMAEESTRRLEAAQAEYDRRRVESNLIALEARLNAGAISDAATAAHSRIREFAPAATAPQAPPLQRPAVQPRGTRSQWGAGWSRNWCPSNIDGPFRKSESTCHGPASDWQYATRRG